MADDIEDVSFLPGDSLNRKSVYEPSVKQRCKQLVCSQGRATVIIVMVGLLILAIALIAAFARSGSSGSNCSQNLQQVRATTVSPLDVTTVNYIATNGKDFPWHNVRLPDSVLPISYDIWLMPRLKDGIFTGKVTILCQVKRMTDTIILHIKKLNITSENIEVKNVESKQKYKITEHLEFVKYQQLLIKLNTKIPTGSRISVYIEYKAALIKQLSGFYLSTYKNKQNETKYLAATQFEATEARSAFPCFDEPAMKATFTLTMIREKGYITLFNMPQSGQSKPYPKDSDFEVDTFKPTVKMSTYLVAFVVCDFARITKKTKSGTDVSVYAPKDQIDQADYALNVAVKVLEYYDKLFQTPYPLPKQDLVAVPDFSAGAMENWGLILYRMTAVLYDSKRTSSHDKQWVAIVVAHELAHQWFGNLVTLKWWDDLWLNEGFASYVEFLGTNAAEPTWNMDAQFTKTHLQRALYRDCLKTSHPIQVPVNNPSEINDIFDSISYDKGASIIRMLKNFMKPEFFDKGISDYLKKYKYSNAVTNDLWQSLSEAKKGELNVKKVMDTWTLQMGFPVVTVSVNNNKMTVSQKRFLIYPKSDIEEKYSSPFGYKWHIPFIYAELGSDDRFTEKFQHFDSESITMDIGSDVSLVKGNYGMFGYYRVNYDDDMWTKIIDKLINNSKVFSESDRAGLIDDAFELARAGMMNHTTVLDMTKYLSNEEGYLPWAAALSGLEYIENRLWDKPEYELLKKYTLNIMKDRIAALGWETKDKPQMTKMLQSLILSRAVRSGDEGVIAKGKQLFQAWMKNTQDINSDLRSVIYKAGIMYGGEKEWDFLLSQYKIAIVPTEKEEMFDALATTKDDHLLERLLQYGLENDDIKSQDLPSLISNVAANVDGQLLAWRLVQRNWQKIRKWFGDTAFSLSQIINACTAFFSTQFDYDEVERFFKDHDAGPGSRAVKTSLEKIQMNIQWLDKYHQEVKKWLQDNPSN